MEATSMDEEVGSPVQRKTTSRRKKSAAQIAFLERLYAENKYPSEEVRAKLSAQLGLSEKQMQIWFTHRRHKDRKDGVEDVKLTFYAMRHKGGEAHLDFMEELNSGKRMGGTFSGREDMVPNGGFQFVSFASGEVSNGRYTADRRRERTERTDSDNSDNSELGEAEDLVNNRYVPPMKRGSLVSRKDRGAYKRPQSVLPRGKQDVLELENAAIAAVEAQLGGSIRVDGPLLGMEFDSLPPDAWSQLNNETGATPLTTVQGRGVGSGKMLSCGTY